ncbi:MAG TPA: hypothetical protein VFN74_09680 [Chloroflexota bacterium]|nr:hypothetical protein [Chloroflexota bacterium]
MKTLEFEAPLGSDRTLEVPPEIASQVDRKRPVHVILLQAEDEDAAWAKGAAEQFLAGYDEGDAIYDDLPPR